MIGVAGDGGFLIYKAPDAGNSGGRFVCDAYMFVLRD